MEQEPLGPREPAEKSRPPRRSNNPPELPFYEEELDLYNTRHEAPSPEDLDRIEDPEEEWYWREPETYWLEEGMWPWPEPPKRRSRHPNTPET